MSAASRRFAPIALAALSLLGAGGFLSGMLGREDALQKRVASEAAEPPLPVLRDPAVALRVLGAQGHWGSYTERETPRTAEATPDATSGADGIAGAWRLVGIEQRDQKPVALLLPVGAEDGSRDVLRLGAGDTLGEGVSVSAVGHDSVRFATPGGSSTLYLYGTQP